LLAIENRFKLNMLLKRINNWFNHAKKYFFTYKEGFFEVSYLANSPEVLVRSVIKMPFVKHNTNVQVISSNNAFVKADLHYQQLEEGLWVTYAKAYYKKNLSYKPIFDSSIDSDYYLLSYNINTNGTGDKAAFLNQINYDNRNWSLIKPKCNVLDCHFKYSKGDHLTLFFSKDWLHNNFLSGRVAHDSKINDFFNNDEHYVLWPDTSDAIPGHIEKLIQTILDKGHKGASNPLQLKIEALTFFRKFSEIYAYEHIKKRHYEMPNSDRLRILKIEKYLSDNLDNKFEGIESLAKKFNISASKFKNDFKLVFGKPVFQHFQEKQMQLAAEIIKTEDIRIKELAARMGYENAGKFSLAFKKHFNVLPSNFSPTEQ
jgi:AraC-like DNA-binding protein